MTTVGDLTRERLDAMTAEQIADHMSTPAGRREVKRVLNGERVVTKEMLLDPGSLTSEEVAEHYDEIVAAQKQASYAPKQEADASKETSE